MRRRDLLKSTPALATASLAASAVAQGVKPLRFIPQANLTVLDPIWAAAVITYNHAYIVYDKLYGWDCSQIRPQMAAGHDISQDELTWTFRLRDGLVFHDKEPVPAGERKQALGVTRLRWPDFDAVGTRQVTQMR